MSARPTPADRPRPDRGQRIEGLVLVLILLTVAGFVGAASFTHVKTWTLNESPHDTPQWFGWANAVISELVPTACALVIRRRRRVGQGVGYPVSLLMAAVGLSLSAQLAVAKPTVSGWLLSAVPALAFIGLTKLVLSTAPPVTPPAAPDAPAGPAPRSTPTVPAERVAGAVPVERAPAPETAPAPAMPAAVPADPVAPAAPALPGPAARANGYVIGSGVVR